MNFKFDRSCSLSSYELEFLGVFIKEHLTDFTIMKNYENLKINGLKLKITKIGKNKMLIERMKTNGTRKRNQQ